MCTEDLKAKDKDTILAARKGTAGDSGHGGSNVVQAVAVVPVAEAGSPSTKKKRKGKKKGEEDAEDAEGDDGKKKEEKVPSYFGAVLRLQKDSLWLIFLGMIFAVVSGGAPLFGFKELVWYFFDLFQFSAETIRTAVVGRAYYILAVIAITMAGQTLDSTCFGVAASRLTAQMRRHAFTAFMRQDIGFFDNADNSVRPRPCRTGSHLARRGPPPLSFSDMAT